MQRFTLTKSLNKHRRLGKSVAILNRSLASPGIFFSASVNNVEHVSRVWTRLQSDKNLGQSRTNVVYLGTIFLELCVNNFMQISVDIQGAHRDKALRDNPNESFAVLYY